MKSKILHRSQLNPTIGLVVGTRPGIIKFSPVIKELQKRNLEFVLMHTGQHYSPFMDSSFFDVLDLPQPNFNNEHTALCKLHGEQTSAMIVGIEQALLQARPGVFIVGGDANTNFAAAVAVRKLVNIRLAHMEAGLRSRDWKMPEEHNRVMIDHISDHLFAPTSACVANLRREGVRGEIVLTGNTIVDAVYRNLELARTRSTICKDLGLEGNAYAVVTLHREENVDEVGVLVRMLRVLEMLDADLRKPLVFPLHPRTRTRLESFDLMARVDSIRSLRVIEPVDYLDMLQLLEGAYAILTDSGGLQEEACVLQRPCITLRENTERPETVAVGANRVVGSSIDAVADALAYFESRPSGAWEIPYGDGQAATRIVDGLESAVADLAGLSG